MSGLRVMVVFGGRSGEHEVSVESARLVCDSLERLGHACVPVGVTREGGWVRCDPRELTSGRVDGRGEPFTLQPHPGGARDVDVGFPVLHGPFGEDGSVQGLFELADLPYVGAGVEGSVICLDKVLQKRIFLSAGLPVVAFVDFTGADWSDDIPSVEERLDSLGYPFFVKPARLGSSVGISKVHDQSELKAAVRRALVHDDLVIAEAQGYPRELEIGVLGDRPELSVVGEVLPKAEFYDYAAKYGDDGCELRVPTAIPGDVEERLRAAALTAFKATYCEGLARVDFFYDPESGGLQVNEINSIPGMTPMSMFPRVWEASGVSFHDVVERLLDHALARRDRRRALETARRAAHDEETARG